MGFHEEDFIRGASPAYNVLDNLEKHVLQGNKTDRYPIEVALFMRGQFPGSPLEPFTMQTSIGNSVVMASYCFAYGTHMHNYLDCDLTEGNKGSHDSSVQQSPEVLAHDSHM